MRQEESGIPNNVMVAIDDEHEVGHKERET
jgi:hypothetical protein